MINLTMMPVPDMSAAEIVAVAIIMAGLGIAFGLLFLGGDD